MPMLEKMVPITRRKLMWRRRCAHFPLNSFFLLVVSRLVYLFPLRMCIGLISQACALVSLARTASDTGRKISSNGCLAVYYQPAAASVPPAYLSATLLGGVRNALEEGVVKAIDAAGQQGAVMEVGLLFGIGGSGWVLVMKMGLLFGMEGGGGVFSYRCVYCLGWVGVNGCSAIARSLALVNMDLGGRINSVIIPFRFGFA